MSEICRRGYKCMCFQCGEKDCEKYEPEPPKWVNELMNDETFIKAMVTTKGGNDEHKNTVPGNNGQD